MPSCDACKSGFSWNGTPTGKETTLGDLKTYVAGDSKSSAILLVHDIFGWTFNNARLLADHFAKEVDATVYLPDFYDGEVVSTDVFTNPEAKAAFSLDEFKERHAKEIRFPFIKASAESLKTKYPKVGAIGYCWGGWAVFQLGADPLLIDAVSAVHPSLLTKEEIDSVQVPVQILHPETDVFSELSGYANKVIPTKGVPYEYVFFPGLVHGFATKADPNDKKQKEGLERAKRYAVNFFNEFLH